MSESFAISLTLIFAVFVLLPSQDVLAQDTLQDIVDTAIGAGPSRTTY